ncbi:HrcA family transcriptional regulator [Campylobacter sp. US33a]|uniref:HrcA family transcriptional regulator n=1 Tax=Campylobacter sp. US33a TaxID=2498120 RepID=UPI001067E030|nr:HrcA family transcriptional regulator [Campylobacter sp. US33a]TEY00938.1 HrcA family transcriptional regulator [Campylobacter sp. US33a]
MKNIKKKDLILESIIEAYLLDNVPIGSNELNLKMSLCIPSSTIRVYFKKLSDEGLLTKLHISGGRIPTISTMQNYWQEHINTKEKISIKDIALLDFLSKENKIYCLVYGGKNLILKAIERIAQKYLILDFEEEQVILSFDLASYEFTKRFLGLELFHIENYALNVGFIKLADKLKFLRASLIYHRSNEQRAYQIYQNDDFNKLLDGTIHMDFKQNLEFDPLFKEGFMGLKLDADFLGKDVNIIFAGSVYTNYKKILKQLKEVA